MLHKVNLSYKRKIIGGSNFGNLPNVAKDVATTTTKAALNNHDNSSQQTGNSLKTTNVKNLVDDVNRSELAQATKSRAEREQLDSCSTG